MRTDILNTVEEPIATGSGKPAGSHFASPERLTPEQLAEEVRRVSAHPLLTTLLGSVGGLLAVLNRHRQILAVNEALLTHLGPVSAGSLFGLRLGEALHCPHASEMAGGCGTSRFCSTCGAAIAQAVALQHQRNTERFCAIESGRNGDTRTLFLKVRACPLALDGHQLILVFIEDYTQQQENALAARSFHHDLNNTLTCLLNASETIVENATGEIASAANEVFRLSERVARELELQRQLVTSGIDNICQAPSTLTLAAVLWDLRALLENHPAGRGKSIVVESPAGDFVFLSDPALLLRVLGNMGINALEATHSPGCIRIKATTGDGIEFSVWNETPIPPEVAQRIFQRNFSTKGGLGRGLGTYSIKLVGEKLLKGRVSFSSSALEGTTFRLRLPP